MAEDSLPWGGTTPGDAGAYSDDNWSDMYRKMFMYDRTVQGVYPGYLNELAVTNPAGTTIRVASGAGMVDGKFYENDDNVDFAVVAPGAGSNYYRIVLRKNWTAQTVRLVLLGPNATAYPGVTQTDGATWEISIATVRITSASAITITDARVWMIRPQKGKVFIAFPGGRNSTGAADIEAIDGVTMPDAASCYATVMWRIPDDYLSGFSAYAVVLPAGTGNMYCDSTVTAGALGEAIGTHDADPIPPGVEAVTSGLLCSVRAATFAAEPVAPGDYVYFQLIRDGTQGADTVGAAVIAYGVYFEYTKRY